MGRSYYFQEVAQLGEQFNQYNYGMCENFKYVLPQWEPELDSYRMLGQYVSQDMGYGAEVTEDLMRHVIEYRENYVDFPISAINMVQQHRDWFDGNCTFIYADLAVFLVEVDNALKMSDAILAGRPECGTSDRQMFVQDVTSQVSTSLSTTLSYMMSSNSYLYSIVNQQILSSFQSLFSMAIMDMYSPLRSLQQLELNFFESNRALIRKQLDNLSRALTWYINSGLLVALTNQREWLLNTVQNADNYACQYPDQ